jgi:hypothetical protein
MGNNYDIWELELNFSNVCTANCIICSRYHGVGNKPLMDTDVFETLVTQLRDIKVGIFQTSGNGEAFLNHHYLDYVAKLKHEFPDTPRWTYNNFSLWTPDKSDRIVNENLFSKIHVRIDSLEKWIFERNSNLNQDIVFDNLKYFLSVNDKIPITLMHNNIASYYAKCKKVLNTRPVRDHFSDEELVQVRGEEVEIFNYFKQFAKCPELMSSMTIGHSLWGERTEKNRRSGQCPKLGVLNSNIWVCPDGSCETCCYSDKQNGFICGNIMEDHLINIFNGSKRKQILENIRNGVYKDYPCICPPACSFGD